MSVATVYSHTAEVENKPHTAGPSQTHTTSSSPTITATSTAATANTPSTTNSPGHVNANDNITPPISVGENTFDSYSFLSRFDRYRNYHSQYSLVIRQQPVQARQSGGREKDRRPIDPPPIVQLINLDNTPDDIYLQNPYLFVYVSLIDPLGESHNENNNGNGDTVNGQASSMSNPNTGSNNNSNSNGNSSNGLDSNGMTTNRVSSSSSPSSSSSSVAAAVASSASALNHTGSGMRPATTDAELRTLPIISKGLCGQLVSSLHRLKDITNEDAGFFIFPDTSARMEGVFRLRFSLYEIRGAQSVRLCSVHSDPFTVYPPRSFPGMSESTFLSRSFSDQGVRIRIRKESRYSTRTSIKRSASAMSMVKQSAVQATADMISLNKRRMIGMNTMPSTSASPPVYNHPHNGSGNPSSHPPHPPHSHNPHNPHEMSYPSHPSHPQHSHHPHYSPSHYQSPPHTHAQPSSLSSAHYYEQVPAVNRSPYPSHLSGYPHQHPINGDQVAHHQRYVYNRSSGTHSMNTAAVPAPGYLSPRSHPSQQHYPGAKPPPPPPTAAGVPHEHIGAMTRRISYPHPHHPHHPHESVDPYYYTHSADNSPANYHHHPASRPISACGDPHCQNPHCGTTMTSAGVMHTPSNVYKQSLPPTQQSHYTHHQHQHQHRRQPSTTTATTTPSIHAYPSRGADRSVEYHYSAASASAASGNASQLSSTAAANTARMPTPTSLSSPTISNSYTNGQHPQQHPHQQHQQHADSSYRMATQIYGGNDKVPSPPTTAATSSPSVYGGHHRTPSTSSTRPSGSPMQTQIYAAAAATAYPHPYDDTVATTTTAASGPVLVTSRRNSMLKHAATPVSVSSPYMNGGQSTVAHTPISNINNPVVYRPAIPRTNSNH